MKRCLWQSFCGVYKFPAWVLTVKLKQFFLSLDRQLLMQRMNF